MAFTDGAAIRLVVIWTLGLYLGLVLFANPPEYPPAKAAEAPTELAVAYPVQHLARQWFGSPALWKPPATDASVYFYDVSGKTQRELLASMLAAKICDHYGPCLPDPGNLGGGALALEGESASAQFCYSPRTFDRQVSYRIVLPRWTPLPFGSVPKTTVTAWNALLPVLWTHETRHVAIAKADIAQLNAQAQSLPSCSAVVAFWSDPHVLDKLNADQNAYHAELRADCRPELGCVPGGWMGW